MKNKELILRLQRATRSELPNPRELLERAFPHQSRKHELPTPLATAAAAAALVAASAAPLLLEPADIDRERTETLMEATALTARLCARDWNQKLNSHD